MKPETTLYVLIGLTRGLSSSLALIHSSHLSISFWGSQTDGRCRLQSRNVMLYEKYTKGTEIQPATNQFQFTLEDSFPDGIIPDVAQQILDEKGPLTEEQFEELNIENLAYINQDEESEKPEGRERRRRNTYGLFKILHRAARKQEEHLESSSENFLQKQLTQPIPKFPIVLLSFLAIKGLVIPSQMLFAVFFSGYLTFLGILAASPIDDNPSVLQPTLASLPPQGHVPDRIANPLGREFSNSDVYRNWLKIGELIGYVGPLAMILTKMVTSTLETEYEFLATNFIFTKFAQLMSCGSSTIVYIASSLFLISCQMITEVVSKRLLAPLPLRILVPIAYNSVRMSTLWSWLNVGWTEMMFVEKGLAMINFVYWGINLFGFLLPIASMRYLRSHFFCVDAKEVVLRDN